MLNYNANFTSYAFLDHTMTVRYKTSDISFTSANTRINSYLNEYINEDPYGDMDQDGIENMNDNCIDVSNPEQSDIDNDMIGDECDYCNSLIGNSNNDNIVNVLDIISTVNIILSGDVLCEDWISNGGSMCEFENSDTNFDTIINVLDIIEIINIILGEPSRNRHCPIVN